MEGKGWLGLQGIYKSETKSNRPVRAEGGKAGRARGGPHGCEGHIGNAVWGLQERADPAHGSNSHGQAGLGQPPPLRPTPAPGQAAAPRSAAQGPGEERSSSPPAAGCSRQGSGGSSTSSELAVSPPRRAAGHTTPAGSQPRAPRAPPLPSGGARGFGARRSQSAPREPPWSKAGYKQPSSSPKNTKTPDGAGSTHCSTKPHLFTAQSFGGRVPRPQQIFPQLKANSLRRPQFNS